MDRIGTNKDEAVISSGGSDKQLTGSEDKDSEAGVFGRQESFRSNSSSESADNSREDMDLHGPLASPVRPTNQLIGQTGYDPNRIPSSVFGTRPGNQMEWSVASNESLFSIHMGNNSFSIDNGFMFYKSGELVADDMNNIPPSTEICNGVDNLKKKSEILQNQSKLAEEESAKAKTETSESYTTEISKVEDKNPSQERLAPVEEIRNSTSSTHSFKFPVLDSDMVSNSSAKVLMVEKQPSRKQSQQESLPQSPGTAPEATKSIFFKSSKFKLIKSYILTFKKSFM
ncbi:hypothetical protein K2173_020245 [Erythroxylum novogranatense]|uniref:Uncharacterized protein n=1 Tax=Erythroxylum novogranatense TaxID=1862640 RepID=A0AAV8U7F1_9ROSI|nr:hypothetical protein K2173_020245 [Erythroxylum novogranatense]